MAKQKDIEFTYSLIDGLFQLAMGDHGDFSGAKYDGDFTLTLEEAQRRKHDFIFESLKLKAGDRVLDLGCGWGPMLNYLRSKGVQGTGVTLSSRQAEYCQRAGLDVHLMDCRKVTAKTFGKFDAVISLGAFEHFCSFEEFDQGKQDEIYRELFKNIHDLIPTGSRFYLQTMVFGKNIIDHDKFDINAEKTSDAFALAQMEKVFPGSWLPYGNEQIIRNIQPYFTLISQSSGRLDYIETIKQWGKRFERFSFKKFLFYLRLLPHYLFSRDFRLAYMSGVSTNTICFERELFEHSRLVFEKV